MKTLNLKKLALLSFSLVLITVTSCRVRLDAGTEPTVKQEKAMENKKSEKLVMRSGY